MKTTEIYTLELFTVGTPQTDLLQWIANITPQIKGVYFESNPNKLHDSILVDIEVDEDLIDTEELEKIIDDIENEYYSRHEIIDCYEYFNECINWD